MVQDPLGLPEHLRGGAGVPLNLPGDRQDADFFRQGGVAFSDAEIDLLGTLDGNRVLILLCGTGEEAVSLANMGAHVVAVDEDVDAARQLASECGVAIEFRVAGPEAVPADLQDGSFDLVYSSFGLLSAIEDIEAWAATVYTALGPAGRLVMYDEHPFAYIVGRAGNDEVLAVTSSYFGVLGDDEEIEDEEAIADAVEHLDQAIEGEGATLGWTVGDVITALGLKGLAVVELRELYSSPRFETPLDAIALPPELLARVPGVLLLSARKMPQ
jgi:SAM-dependent methyltransferase